MSTKLFVPDGAPIHSRGGEVSPPSQVYFFGIAPIAENAGEVTLNDEAPASAIGVMSAMAAVNALLQRCAIFRPPSWSRSVRHDRAVSGKLCRARRRKA